MKIAGLILAVLVLLCPTAYAKGHHSTIINEVTNVTNVTNVEETHNAFDFGTYLDIVAFETPATQWGVHTTYTVEDSEVKAFVGGTIYLNRLFQKKQ